jgi:AbrB family looped-hinge helix DNA binding protein
MTKVKEMTMSTATVSSKGQITLPMSLRKALGIKPGDKVDLSAVGNRAILTKARKGDILAYVKNLKPTPGPVPTKKETELMVMEEVAMHYERKRREGRA